MLFLIPVIHHLIARTVVASAIVGGVAGAAVAKANEKKEDAK